MNSTPKQKPFIKIVRSGFITAFAALVVIYLLLILSHQQLKKQTALLFTHQPTVMELEQQLFNLQDTEKAILNKSEHTATQKDSIKSTIEAMLMAAQNLVLKETAEQQAHFTKTSLLLFLAMGGTLLFAGIGYIHYQQSHSAIKTQLGYQQQLTFQTAALDKANKELVVARRHQKFDNADRIAQTIAHEVRNPLNNIDLAVNQLKTDLPQLGENTSILLELIDRNSKRINQLISNLLNEIRLSDSYFQALQINQIIDEALELAKDRILLMQMKVEKHYDAGLPPIFGNAEKLRTAFLNLIINALESIDHQKGMLQISTKVKDNKCVVDITDNGAGMTEEVQSKLFEPYFTTKKKGVGLGLTNTRNIIQNHKGAISLNSSPGKGSTFTLQFNFNA